MKTSSLISLFTPGVTCLLLSEPGRAATIQTVGSGSAVAVADRSAAFDSLNPQNWMHLENYTEGGLSITTSADSWAADFAMAALCDPFYGANGTDRTFYAISAGNNDWVTIQTTDGLPTYGAEFMYGNTWTSGDFQRPWGNPNAIFDWQTWRNQVVVSSGSIGPPQMLPLGTIVGFYDPAGFDQLLVRCTSPNSTDPTLQAAALDTLQVMLTNRPPAPLVYGSDLSFDRVTGVPTLTVYETIPGCQYRLIYTETLEPTAWNPVTPPAPAGWVNGGGTLTFTDPGATGRPHGFYRVEVR
jgi:hypothetical protein